MFFREFGDGPSMTLLHGLPSSSHEWHKLTPALATEHRLLVPDLLGFGASAKPADHRYSLFEQADLVEALWRRQGVRSTVLVAHDYAATIAQELLARRSEARLDVTLERVHLSNAGLYPDLHRPEPIQTALLDPEQGPRLVAQLTEEQWLAALRPTFAPHYDAAQDARDMWREVTHGGNVLHRLMHYMPERRENAERWVGALETTDVPLSFAWGMLDPISGAHMAERIRQRRPDAPFVALDDVGHWPVLEAPDRVLHTLR
jgi:pimeloyl-ACP methyl ester carboxylesterase